MVGWLKVRLDPLLVSLHTELWGTFLVEKDLEPCSEASLAASYVRVESADHRSSLWVSPGTTDYSEIK